MPFASTAGNLGRNMAAVFAAAAIIAAPARGHAQGNRPAQSAAASKAKAVGCHADVKGIETGAPSSR